jgi:hypothetical protein
LLGLIKKFNKMFNILAQVASKLGVFIVFFPTGFNPLNFFLQLDLRVKISVFIIYSEEKPRQKLTDHVTT